MIYARSLRHQIPNLRALSSLFCQQVTQPEAQSSTMAAVAEPQTKKAKTEYNHTREVRRAAQKQQQPAAATYNRLLQARPQPEAPSCAALIGSIILSSVSDDASQPRNVLSAVDRRSLMCMPP